MKEIEIEKLGMNAEGIGRLDNKVCFVKYALPKEVVSVEILENKKNFLTCDLKEIKNKSKYRVLPKCPYFSICGGCDLQHLDYVKQLEYKKELIEETFKKIADIDLKVSDIVFDKNLYYRNKAVFSITSLDNKIILGMKKENSNEIIEIKKCLLQDELINKVLELAKDFLNNNSFLVHSNKELGLKYLVIRVIDSKALITFVSDKKIDGLNKFSNYLEKENIDYGLYLNVNEDNKNILSNKSYYIKGLKELELNINQIKCLISPNSFMQVNTYVFQKLYEKVCSLLENEVVYDCYSGAGIMSALISKKAKKVYGIEISKSASKDAERLKEINNITNLINVNGDTQKELPKLLKNNKESFSVVLDPPRNGCFKEVLNLLKEHKPLKIVYISCLPRTLARDINILKESYDIKTVIAYEMFPMTKHIETLVYLEKKR